MERTRKNCWPCTAAPVGEGKPAPSRGCPRYCRQAAGVAPAVFRRLRCDPTGRALRRTPHPSRKKSRPQSLSAAIPPEIEELVVKGAKETRKGKEGLPQAISEKDGWQPCRMHGTKENPDGCRGQMNLGDVLLSHTLVCSTIAAGGLNFCIRDGNRCTPSAMAAKKLAKKRKTTDN